MNTYPWGYKLGVMNLTRTLMSLVVAVVALLGLSACSDAGTDAARAAISDGATVIEAAVHVGAAGCPAGVQVRSSGDKAVTAAEAGRSG